MTQETTIINTFSNIVYSETNREDVVNLTEGNDIVVNINSTEIKQETLNSYPLITVINNQTTIESLEQDTTIYIKDNPITINIAAGSFLNSTDSNPYIFIEAAENIPPYRVCYVRGDQAFVASNTMNIEYANLIQGVSVSEATTGNIVQIQLAEKIYNVNWNFTKGKPIYLGVNGNLVQTVPVAGLLCELGMAIDSSMLYLDIEEPTNLG